MATRRAAVTLATVRATRPRRCGRRGRCARAMASDAATFAHESSLAAMGFAPTRRDDGAGAAVMTTSATCPFAHRPWLALVELDAPFALEVENLEKKSARFEALYRRSAPDASGNPSVPILEHDGATMVESALVLQYVCATFEKPGGASLRPTSAKAAYYGQLFADNFQACVPLYFKMLRATSEDELREATTAFIDGLKKANRCLELGVNARDGPYACGAQFTTCDIMAMTFVPRFEIVLAHYRGFDVRRAIKENDCAALESWMAAVSTRPSMQYTLAKIENMTGKTLANAFIDHFAKFVSWRSDSSVATVSA
jgi:glutathione S-transferase